MKDAYTLKRILLSIAQPQGEVNHGEVLDALQGGNYKVDPFLTNLSRGVIAIEGTLKTLSPNVSILNCFIGKVDIGMDLNLDNEHLKEMNPEIALKLLLHAS